MFTNGHITWSTASSISKPEPAILCGGLLRLWGTPVNFARKSVHLNPVPRSTFITMCRQTWILPLFKFITTLFLQRTLARVLKCCKIMVVIYLTCLITVNRVLFLENNTDFPINKYYTHG
jgi:hypothetical protein